jgi:hypothetical protein
MWEHASTTSDAEIARTPLHAADGDGVSRSEISSGSTFGFGLANSIRNQIPVWKLPKSRGSAEVRGLSPACASFALVSADLPGQDFCTIGTAI